MDDSLLDKVANSIDRLITVDVSGRGIIENLYSFARAQSGGPLSLAAAKLLMERVKKGDFVILTTGCKILPYENGETDGPVSAATLARALELGLGAKPVIVTEEALAPMIGETCRGAGLCIADSAKLGNMERAVAVESISSDPSTASGQAASFIEKFKPRAVIAIEKLGPNKKGVVHSMRGMSRDVDAKSSYLFDCAINQKIATIGIGDGGNEIGMGKIREAVEKFVPFGSECKCPCGSGISDNTKVDVVIPSTLSNWGAYAIEACLSILVANPDIMHDEEVERATLTACVAGGGIDGITRRPEASVDHLPLPIQTSIISIMRTIARSQPH